MAIDIVVIAWNRESSFRARYCLPFVHMSLYNGVAAVVVVVVSSCEWIEPEGGVSISYDVGT